MTTGASTSSERLVALLTESVDRNRNIPRIIGNVFVALLTESVDRNRGQPGLLGALLCRSPHGERG